MKSLYSATFPSSQMKLSLLYVVVFVGRSVAIKTSASPVLSSIVSRIKEWTLSTPEIPFPSGFLTVHELIEKEGFVSEAHEVVTDDGYVLALTRILPDDGGDADARGRPPILMVHGVEAASDQWVLRGIQDDLAFMLIDNGFDVWLADVRGNCYSRRHLSLSVNDPQFWNFTFHEIAVHDVPAFVDYVLNATGFDKIGYIGHSMGTTEFLVLTSLLPEYNDKISVSVLLAPVGPKYPLEEIKSFFTRFILVNHDMLIESLVAGGVHDFHPRTSNMVKLIMEFCEGPPLQDYCLDGVGVVVGENRSNLDKLKLFRQLAHFPAGSSIKSLQHLGQTFNSGFKQFDYGPDGNREIYNNTSPPFYPLHRITTPTYMFYGDNDPWTSSKVVKYLAETIPGVKLAKLVPDLKFTHFDFLIGLNANETLYQDVLQILRSYYDADLNKV